MWPRMTVQLILLYQAIDCSCESTVLTFLIDSSHQLISWRGSEVSPEALKKKNNTSTTCNSANGSCPVTDLLEADAIMRDSELLTFYNRVYSQLKSLFVFIDLRHDACPIDLFRQGLLAYITVSPKQCPGVAEATSRAAITVETWSFDLMTFMPQFLASWAPAPGVEHIQASFALFFDNSGEDHFWLPNRKTNQKVILEVTLPLTDCSSSDHVTNLAAKTNTKDVVVIARTSCIYDLLLSTSRLHLQPTRFRWLLYPTDYNSTFDWGGLLKYLDTISPIILTERGKQEGRPVYSHTKLLRYANRGIASFQSAMQDKETDSECVLECAPGCQPCQRLYREGLLQIPGQMYEVFTSQKQNERQSIVFDLSRITAAGEIYLGNWSQNMGLSVNQVVYSSNFTDSRLSVVVIVEPPFVFRNVSENGVVSYSGYSMDVLREIAKRVGFSYTVSECQSGGYGLLEKGTWTGCMGNIARGEADVILGALTVTAERDQVVDFTLPYYSFAGIHILMKKQTVNINLFYYANVFTTKAWLSLAAVVVVTCLLLWAFEKVMSPQNKKRNYCVSRQAMPCQNPTPVSKSKSSRSGLPAAVTSNDTRKSSFADRHVAPAQVSVSSRNQAVVENAVIKKSIEANMENEEKNLMVSADTMCTFGESVWYVIGHLTMTSGGDPPRSFSGRLLVAGFWFFAVIMMSAFTANLAAFLTVSRMSLTISSLDDLVGQTDVKYGVVNQSSVMEYFKRMAQIEKDFYERWKSISLDRSSESTQDSLAVWDYPLGNKYGAMWDNIKETGLIASNEIGRQKVLSENFALITESPLIQYYTGRSCDLVAVGEQFSIRPYAIGLKERSPYTSKFSETILDLQKERELGSMRLRWWASNEVSCPKETGSTGLDLYSLSGTFIVAGAGVASGFFVLGLEHVVNRMKKKKKGHKVPPRSSSVDQALCYVSAE